MKSYVWSISLLFVSGCTLLNIVDDGYGLCRSINAGYPESLYEELRSEARRDSPNGYLTQPYSRENWNKYWNNRVYYVWDIGPESCGGTYEGLSGPEIIRLMLRKRQSMQLPKIEWDERNSSKDFEA